MTASDPDNPNTMLSVTLTRIVLAIFLLIYSVIKKTKTDNIVIVQEILILFLFKNTPI